MITFDTHYAIGCPTVPVKNSLGVFEHGVEVGAIYWMPTLASDERYSIIVKKQNLGSCSDLAQAKRIASQYLTSQKKTVAAPKTHDEKITYFADKFSISRDMALWYLMQNGWNLYFATVEYIADTTDKGE